MTVTGRVWTPESYTEFALTAEWESLWALAVWIRDFCDRRGVSPTSIGDFGAGPAVLSTFLANRFGVPVTAYVQDGFPPVARMTTTRLGGAVLLADLPPIGDPRPGDGPLGEHDLVVCYGCFHEMARRADFLAAMSRAARPNGRLMVIDTVREASAMVRERSAAGGAAPASDTILNTFASSLTLEEFQRVASDLRAESGSVEFSNELLMDAYLSLPDRVTASGPAPPAIESDQPTLRYVAWKKA